MTAEQPAIDALQRLLDAASTDHDRELLRAALDAVRAAYASPATPPLEPSEAERPAATWPLWEAHDDPTVDHP